MSNLAWTLAAVNRIGLPALPHDLLLQIYSLLDVPSAVALSQTCRSLHGFAASRTAWLTLARTLAISRELALPAEKQLTKVPAELSTEEMRAAIQHTVKLANNLNRPNPALNPGLALALPEATTVVHSALLPGARFLLTVQHGGTFACWDLAVTEPVVAQPPAFPRRRSMRTQTNSLDGIDVEMGHESDDEMLPEYENNARDNLRRPRCVATWETGAEYVEFAYDLVPGGVLVALMVAIQVGQDPPILKRDMYVVHIDLPTSTAPLPLQSLYCPTTSWAFGTASTSTSPPPLFAGRHYGLAFIAHSPLRHPVFISTIFINASGHAGILGDIPDTMVVFVLLFDPNVPAISLSPSSAQQPGPTHPIRCATSLVHCGFKCAPGTRYTALSTSAHVLLYAESTSKTMARRIEVRSLRRRWAASASSNSSLVECIDLGVKVLGTPRVRDFIGSPGTEGAPFYTTVRAMLRRSMPKWLRSESQKASKEPRKDGRRTSSARKGRSDPMTVCALGLSVDEENRRADIFRGLVLGAHDLEVDSEAEDASDEEDEDVNGHSSRANPGRVVTPTPSDSYSMPTPSQSSLLGPAQTDVNETSTSTSSSSSVAPLPPLRRPFRRHCRIRYKRTIFPAHVNYAHELAGMGSFGRYAAWIEGDGVPEEMDWQKEPLRVIIAPLSWEDGTETYPELENEESGKAEAAIRHVAGSTARVLSVPSALQPKLNMVSCVALEDAAGVLAMATLEGQVYVFGLAA